MSDEELTEQWDAWRKKKPGERIIDDHGTTVDQYLAGRKEAGKRIDPRTAKVTWCWSGVLDPYRVFTDLPEDNIGRAYFVCSSDGDDGWIWNGDLPDGVWAAIQARLATEPPTEVEEPIPF
jgi:hypothetical protein